MNLFDSLIRINGVTFLMLCVFGIAAVGYCIGRITIKGVDLGTSGVFLAALVFGAFFFPCLEKEFGEFTKTALKIIENTGLILFVTSVGFIAGPGFFENLKTNFKSYVLLGIVIIFTGWAAAVISILIGRAAGVTDPQKLTAIVSGLFSGAMTSTPAFSAAKATVDPALEDLVSVGYGIAYIFGVVGVVLFVQLVPKLTHSDMNEELRKFSEVGKGGAAKEDQEDLIHVDPFGVMPFAFAVVIGIIVGMIRIPLSMKGFDGTCFSLTITGGCLLSALVIGHFGKFGRISMMPYRSSLKVFREFGLALFLIGAGTSAGAQFVANFSLLYFAFGVLITVSSMVTGYFFAEKVLKLNLLNALSAVTGGMTSTPALGTLISVAGSEEIASAYAATYPIALISVVLATQFLIILF